MKKKLAIVALSALVALPVAEGVLRAWLALRGKPYSSQETADKLLRLVDPARAFVPQGGEEQVAQPGEVPGLRRPILHPFTGTESAHDTGGVLGAFQRGLPPDSYTVVVVGGSVAAAWAMSGLDQIQRRLEQDPRFAGKRVRLLNYAHHSYKQPQQVMRIAYLFSLGYRPDAVIALDGFNEVALGMQNLLDGTHPVYPAAPVWGSIVRDLNLLDGGRLEWAGQLWNLRKEADRKATRALTYNLHRSCILGTWVLGDMRRINQERFKLYQDVPAPGGSGSKQADRQRSGPEYERSPEAVLESSARNWFESSLSLQALCEARGVYYLHVLQPTLHDEGAKIYSEEERNMGAVPQGWLEGAQEGYPLLRGYAPELLARGVRFHDASRIFEGMADTLYFDDCHLNQRGNELMGEVVASAFVEGFPWPVPPDRD